MKEYWEWRYSSTHSLTSVLDGGEWSASRAGCFTSRERAPLTPLDRRLDGPQSRSGRGGEIPSPRRESNPRTLLYRLYWRYLDCYLWSVNVGEIKTTKQNKKQKTKHRWWINLLCIILIVGCWPVSADSSSLVSTRFPWQKNQDYWNMNCSV
jgi:hypothetical protein